MIPFIELNRDENEKSEIAHKISEFYDRGMYILGEYLDEFEKSFSEFTGIPHAIGVNSGTDAIYIILKANSAKSVGVCASAPLPCAQAIALSGANPVFIDTYSNTGLIDTSDLLRKIGKIDTLLAVHLHGRPEDLDSLSEICTKKNILIVEDCSQSAGTVYKGKHTGFMSASSAFSFYPTKNLGALGDGGMVMTHDAKLASLYRAMRNYGISSDEYTASQFGLNTRLDPIQAAVLSARLKKLAMKTERRRTIMEMYRKGIHNELIELPDDDFFANANGHIMPVFTGCRDSLRRHLKENGIETAVHYMHPLHMQPYFRSGEELPAAEKMAAEELSLPVFPELTDGEVSSIIQAINGFSH